MRPIFQLIAVGLLCCGCQGTGPAKYDNPVVGPPPPRLPVEQIQRKKLAAAELRDSRETKVTANADLNAQDDSLQEGDRSIKQASAKRATVEVGQTPDEEPAESSGIQQIKLSGPFPKLEDGTIVAAVNGQPIFAGEILAPAVGQLAKTEEEMKKAYGDKYKPEMLDRIKVIFIAQSLPRAVERRMLNHAAKTELKKQQLEMMKKAIAGEWEDHLKEMMEQNHLSTVPELEEVFKKSNFNLEEHKASWEEQRVSYMFVSAKVHTKYQPSRVDMINFYEEHKEEFKTEGKVLWQQLVVSFEDHKGQDGARLQIDKVVKELLAGADFGETVKKYGDGPRAKKGGMWDWTARGSLQSKEVENEIFSLPIGEMSGVIETKNSFQIVQVLERTEDSYTPFEQLQEKIKQQMLQKVFSEKANALIKSIRDSSTITTCFDDDEKTRKKGLGEE